MVGGAEVPAKASKYAKKGRKKKVDFPKQVRPSSPAKPRQPLTRLMQAGLLLDRVEAGALMIKVQLLVWDTCVLLYTAWSMTPLSSPRAGLQQRVHR